MNGECVIAAECCQPAIRRVVENTAALCGGQGTRVGLQRQSRRFSHASRIGL